MFDQPEDFITVEEAAQRLRIGRTRAYVEARLYVESGGTEGIVPAIPVGRIYRVPVARLEEIAGGPMRSFHRAGRDAGPTVDPEPVTNDARADDLTDRRPRRGNRRKLPTAQQLFDI